MRFFPTTPVHRYVAAVSMAGLACFFGLLAASLAPGAPDLLPQDERATLLAFFVFLVLGELFPIEVPRDGGEKEAIATSTTFAFAILLVFGTPVAIVAQALASVAGDLWARIPWWKMLFNAAQLVLALAAAGAVLSYFGPQPMLVESASLVGQLPAVAVAGAVYFLINSVLAGASLALALETPIVVYLRQDFAFQALTAGMLLGLAPVVVVAANFNLALLPLLSLPLVGIYKGGRQAIMSEHQALHDGLTDLPNRMLFRDRVTQAIAAADRDGHAVAIMIMDLDRFKEINDTLGHHNGDLVLRQVGPRIQDLLRRSDTVARLGGDEFAVLLPSLHASSAGTPVAEKLLEVFQKPFPLQELTLNVEPSVGVAFFPEHGNDVDTLIQRADVAMYVAKKQHRGFEIYSSHQDQYSPGRLALVGELRRAIEEDELVLHYQPKADFRTGRVDSVEALVRWQHPKHGLMPPEEFIPVAEHTGLIRPLTLHILDQAMSQCSAWRALGLRLGIAVNLSVFNLLDLDLPSDVSGLLGTHGLSPSDLTLEITESVIMTDTARSLGALKALKEMGIGLSVDDFGTGHSALAYLKDLPVNELKIDKSFITNMSVNKSDAVIVRSTIDLGRNLGLRVVAEGVEADTVWNQLQALGCDIAQGYYLSRPIPAHAVERWIRVIYPSWRSSQATGSSPGSLAGTISAHDE